MTIIFRIYMTMYLKFRTYMTLYIIIGMVDHRKTSSTWPTWRGSFSMVHHTDTYGYLTLYLSIRMVDHQKTLSTRPIWPCTWVSVWWIFENRHLLDLHDLVLEYPYGGPSKNVTCLSIGMVDHRKNVTGLTYMTLHLSSRTVDRQEESSTRPT